MSIVTHIATRRSSFEENAVLMAELIRLQTPLSDEEVSKLRAGDRALLSGAIYTARDAAHKRLLDIIEKGGELPFDLKGQVIYYVGPTPTKPGNVIGSAGPTTSYRMDSFAPKLYELGIKATIGKGQRSEDVREAMMKHKGVYLVAVGGAAALIAKQIISCAIIAYEDLGAEAIRKLVVKDLPVIVANDTLGNDLYTEAVQQFAR